MNILLVDDSSSMRMMIKRSLRQSMVEIDDIKEGDSAEEGLKQLEEHTPDVVLSDWNMPGKDGGEFLAEVREKYGDIPFGFVTSQISKDHRRTASEHDANFFLTKPLTNQKIEQALHNVEDSRVDLDVDESSEEDYAQRFGDTIEELFARVSVEAQEVDTPSKFPKGGAFAIFRGEDDEVVGCYHADFTAANYLGAAMSMIPAAGAEENIDKKDLPQTLRENLGEIFNVCTRFFMELGVSSAVFDKVIVAQDSRDRPDVLDDFDVRRSVRVDIQRYGEGQINQLLLSD